MNFQPLSKNRMRVIFLLLSIVCGIIDYWICDLVAWVNNLPLFCDTIFIMALSFIAGPWWGVLAGVFYHLFDFLMQRNLALGNLFMICHFLAALTAGYYKICFIKNDDAKLILFVKLLILSMVMCLVMSISGGIISYILQHIEAYKDSTSQTDFLTFMWQNKFNSKLLLEITVRIPVNIPDRLICVFAAWGIYLSTKAFLNRSGSEH